MAFYSGGQETGGTSFRATQNLDFSEVADLLGDQARFRVSKKTADFCRASEHAV